MRLLNIIPNYRKKEYSMEWIFAKRKDFVSYFVRGKKISTAISLDKEAWEDINLEHH